MNQSQEKEKVTRKVDTVSLVIIATILTGVAIRWLQPVLISLVLSLFVTVGLSALIRWFEIKLRIPRAPAVGATIILAGLAFALISSVISASISQLSNNAAPYQEMAANLVALVGSQLPASVGNYIKEAGHTSSLVPVSAVGPLILGATDTFLEILSKSLLVIIFVVFLMIGQSRSSSSSGIWAEIEGRIQRYIVIKSLVSALTGILVGLTLWTIGVPMALAFGLLTFLLNFVPSVGSFMAILLPIPLMLSLTGPQITLAITLPAAIHFVIGNILEPKWMKDSLDLHPVVILSGLIFWGMLWGVAGMLLATPILVVAKILLSKFEQTKALADLLAGRLASFRSPRAS